MFVKGIFVFSIQTESSSARAFILIKILHHYDSKVMFRYVCFNTHYNNKYTRYLSQVTKICDPKILGFEHFGNIGPNIFPTDWFLRVVDHMNKTLITFYPILYG